MKLHHLVFLEAVGGSDSASGSTQGLLQAGGALATVLAIEVLLNVGHLIPKTHSGVHHLNNRGVARIALDPSRLVLSTDREPRV